MIAGKRCIDLSHELHPGEEEYLLELDTHMIDEVLPQYKRRPDIWYTMQTLHLSSHVGTHIEFPKHFRREGLDSASFPLERLIGPASVLDFRYKKDNEAITLADVQNWVDEIQEGDIIILHTGRSASYHTSLAHNRPYLEPDAALWLIERKGMHVLGVDATGVEIKETDYQPVHTTLLKDHDCALIECITGLEQLKQSHVQVIILPLKISGLDSSPIRLIAIEDVTP